MKSAVVTGGSSGIGAALVERLAALGYRVWSLSRREPQPAAREGPVVRLGCDLREPRQIAEAARQILAAEPKLAVLVNNAGLGRFSPHEEIPEADLVDMVAVNLTAPLLLTRHLLRRLRDNQGLVVNIGSTAGMSAGHRGGAYAATKAGVLQFGECLFEECRKSGLRVANLVPDITDTAFYDALDFGPDDDPASSIAATEVAAALETLLSVPAGTVITSLVVQPQLRRVKRKKRAIERQGNPPGRANR